MTNIICFGDSITEGAEFPLETRWTSLLQQKLDEAKPGVFNVHNRGIGGNTSAQGRDRLLSDVIPLLPGILLIQFGFNDANVYDFTAEPRVRLEDFKNNLTEFYYIAATNKGVPIFVLNHSIGKVNGRQGNGCSYNDNYWPYHAAIKELANELNAVLIDIPQQMVNRKIKTEKFVSDDQLHLSVQANQYYADIVFSCLKEIDL